MSFRSACAQQPIPLAGGEVDPVNPADTVLLPELQPLARSEKPVGAWEIRLVQWEKPIDNETRGRLEAAGFRWLAALPPISALVAVPVEFSAKAADATHQALPAYSLPMEPGWKLNPDLAQRINAEASAVRQTRGDLEATLRNSKESYYLQLAKIPQANELLLELRLAGQYESTHSDLDHFETVRVEGTLEDVLQWSGHPAVFWIEPYSEPQMFGERGALAISGGLTPDGRKVTGPRTYANWLAGTGLSGEGLIVHMMDDGLSRGDASNTPGSAHPDFVGRIAGIDNFTSEPLGNSVTGHGNINASILLGQPLAGGGREDFEGFLLGQGVAPMASIYATKIFNNTRGFDISGNSFATLVQRGYRAGARIGSNSWGSNVGGLYDVNAQLFDRLVRDADLEASGLQEMTMFFSAGNAGPVGTTIGTPGTAKNVICIGAMENSDAHLIDGCNTGPLQSDDMRDVAGFSSRGPMRDGRIGPTLVATGTHVTGAASDDPAFNGGSVCGRQVVEEGESPDADKYYPAFQSDYTWSSGTSHSTPIVAGAGVLFFEYYSKSNGVPPSPALTKAALVAGANDPVGGNNNAIPPATLGNIPNNHAGWGRVQINQLVDPLTQSFSMDQTTLLHEANDVFTQDLQILPGLTSPVKIVLTWTDALGSPVAAKALVNDLDLTVSDGERTWRGNVIEGGVSVEGGEPDRLNNIEVVILPAGVQGKITITVRAEVIAGDARPDSGALMEQDFALYAINASSQTSFGLVTLDGNIFACSDTLPIELSDSDLINSGTTQVLVSSAPEGDSELLTLTEKSAGLGIFKGLLPVSDGVPVTANDGVLAIADGSEIIVQYFDATEGPDGEPLVSMDSAVVDCQPPRLLRVRPVLENSETIRFEIKADEPVIVRLEYGPACNFLDTDQVVLEYDVSHSLMLRNLNPCSVYYHKLTLVDRAGNATVLDQNGSCFVMQTPTDRNLFLDTMEIGARNWSVSNDRGSNQWEIVTTEFAHSGTHAWFVPNPAVTTDARLTLAPVFVEPSARLRFWHTYSFETSGVGRGFDGGVIEISIDGGATWEDLGNAIVEGEYNALINGVFSNPLGGRLGWSGGQLGEMTRVSVDLAAYEGQIAQFRFRMGSDEAFARPGWYVDDVAVIVPDLCAGELAVVAFDQNLANCAEPVGFRVLDTGLVPGQQPAMFRIASSAAPDDTVDILPTTILPSGAGWMGELTAVATTSGTVVVEGTLDLGVGEDLVLQYFDADIVPGGQWVEDQIAFDCLPPQLLTLETPRVQHDNFVVRTRTDKPVRVIVHYREEPVGRFITVDRGPTIFSDEFYIGVNELQPVTTYSYFVELIDHAGNITTHTLNGHLFQTTTQKAAVYSDDLEPSPQFGWTIQSIVGQSDWSVVQTPLAHSGQHTWFVSDQPHVRDVALISPLVTLTSHSELTFWHTYDMEKSIFGSFDGSVLEASVDGGQTWIDLADEIVESPYNSILFEILDNPLGGRFAWSGGELRPMQRVRVELNRFDGQRIQIRFRHGSDAGTGRPGWYIDDFNLATFTMAGSPIIPDPPRLMRPSPGSAPLGYSMPLELEWSPVAGAQRYQVYVSIQGGEFEYAGETPGSSFALPVSELFAASDYRWRVEASIGDLRFPSGVRGFSIEPVDLDIVVDALVGRGNLPEGMARAVDYNRNNELDITDLITLINRLP